MTGVQTCALPILVRSEQRDIFECYKDDFAKHLNEAEEEVIDMTLLMKINKVYSSIPAQLSKENKNLFIQCLNQKELVKNMILQFDG